MSGQEISEPADEQLNMHLDFSGSILDVGSGSNSGESKSCCMVIGVRLFENSEVDQEAKFVLEAPKSASYRRWQSV